MHLKRLLLSHAVLLIVLVAAGVRVGYVAIAKRGPCPIEFQGQVVGYYHSQCTGASAGDPNDQEYYNSAANQIADGNGFTDAFHPGVPTADHPPLTAVVLGGVSFAFDHLPLSKLADETHLPAHVAFGGAPSATPLVARTHVREQRYFMALLGTLNVFLLILLARRMAGNTVALVAGAFAALYPYLWVNDGLLFSETVAITCVLLALLAACWCRERVSPWRFAVLGALCSVAALARAELLVLAPLLVLALAWWARAAGPRAVTIAVVAGAAGCVAVLAPWSAYNSSRFHDRVFISTNDGLALAGSNCAPEYNGSGIGLWTNAPPCAFSDAQLAHLDATQFARTHRHLDQSDISDLYRHKALTYMRDNLGRLPVVVAARVGRAWSVYRPLDMISFNQGESRERWVTELGLVAYYPLILLAIAGGLAMIRRRAGPALWILVVPAISVTLVAAATYGQTRLRATAEPSIVILAAVGAGWGAETLRSRRAGDRSGDRAGAAAGVPVPRP
jgi:4-amino-4-deoxy-L-arabinose transferase-like glycosyltransferase